MRKAMKSTRHRRLAYWLRGTREDRLLLDELEQKAREIGERLLKALCWPPWPKNPQPILYETHEEVEKKLELDKSDE